MKVWQVRILITFSALIFALVLGVGFNSWGGFVISYGSGGLVYISSFLTERGLEKEAADETARVVQ
jgi:hypothetical protein